MNAISTHAEMETKSLNVASSFAELRAQLRTSVPATLSMLKERLGLEKARCFEGIDDQSTFHDDASLASITSGVKAINI